MSSNGPISKTLRIPSQFFWCALCHNPKCFTEDPFFPLCFCSKTKKGIIHWISFFFLSSSLIVVAIVTGQPYHFITMSVDISCCLMKCWNHVVFPMLLTTLVVTFANFFHMFFFLFAAFTAHEGKITQRAEHFVHLWVLYIPHSLSLLAGEIFETSRVTLIQCHHLRCEQRKSPRRLNHSKWKGW